MQNAGATDQLSRPQAIERIRGALLARAGEEECACCVAARFGVFCRGFQSLSDRDFRRRFDWIARSRPQATRAELEHVVGLYHLGRQEVTGAALCCDVETREHCVCDGWNRFDNAALEKFCLELTGRSVRIG
jgi:hypothetical protein